MNSSGEETPWRHVGWKLFSISRPDCETAAPFGHRAESAVEAMLGQVASCPSPSMATLFFQFCITSGAALVHQRENERGNAWKQQDFKIKAQGRNLALKSE